MKCVVASSIHQILLYFNQACSFVRNYKNSPWHILHLLLENPEELPDQMTYAVLLHLPRRLLPLRQQQGFLGGNLGP